jgi:hypothetical protein
MLGVSASGQHARNAIPAECGLSYDDDPMTAAPNADGTVTFTQPGIVTSCIPAQRPEAPCQFCLAFQLLQWGGGNVWVVIQPPYPRYYEINVACDTSQARDLTDTTPALGPGSYVMTSYLRGGPCLGGPGGVPTTVQTTPITVIAR